MLSIIQLLEKKQEFDPGKKTETGEYTHYDPKDKPNKSDAVKDSDGHPFIRSKKFISKKGEKVVLRFQLNKDTGKMDLLSKLKKSV